MSNPTHWMRSFSIRLRMHGAIVVVMGLFALVGATGLIGGRHLAALNSDFMAHSVKEVHDVGAIRLQLGQVRQHEKDMVIHYEKILLPLVTRHWAVADVVGLNAAGEQAREKLLSHLDRLAKVARRLTEKANA